MADGVVANNPGGIMKKLTKRSIWGTVLILVLGLIILIAQTCVDNRQARKAYERSLGTWQNAYDSGVLIKETIKHEAQGNHVIEVKYKLYDVTGDGIPDFEITTKWDKPYKWQYLKDGEPYD